MLHWSTIYGFTAFLCVQPKPCFQKAVLQISCSQSCWNSFGETPESSNYSCHSSDSESPGSTGPPSPAPQTLNASWYIHEDKKHVKTLAVTVSFLQIGYGSSEIRNFDYGFSLKVAIDGAEEEKFLNIRNIVPGKSLTELDNYDEVNLTYSCVGLESEGWTLLNPGWPYEIVVTGLPVEYSEHHQRTSMMVELPACDADDLKQTVNCPPYDLPAPLSTKKHTRDTSTASSYPLVIRPVRSSDIVTGVLIGVISSIFILLCAAVVYYCYIKEVKHYRILFVVDKRAIDKSAEFTLKCDQTVKALQGMKLNVAYTLWIQTEMERVGCKPFIYDQLQKVDFVIFLCCESIDYRIGNSLLAEEDVLQASNAFTAAGALLRENTRENIFGAKVLAIHFKKMSKKHFPEFISKRNIYFFPRDQNAFFRNFFSYRFRCMPSVA